MKTTYSQFNYGGFEAGVIIAPSNFLGDLGGNAGKGTSFLKDNNLSMTRLFAGAHISYLPADWYGIRLAINYGNIAGDDGIIKGKGGLEEARKIRNLNFKSAIAEAYLVGELYPTVFLEADPSDRFHKFRPYGIAGIGVFHFNPKGKDPQTGDWVNLKPLHTEGQGFPELPGRKNYSLTQLNIPLGIGIKYFLSERVSVGFDILTRKTFTDYIDDVSTDYVDNSLFYKNLPLSTAIVANRMYDKSAGSANRNAGEKRGTSGHNDSYYAAGIKLSIRFGDINPLLSSSRCPIFKK
ncbi:MAG: outer membrane beta-barrel protein [Williamsia sp.]|nr:outer membrane beta-barrel protein [Williamsia sp.]